MMDPVGGLFNGFLGQLLFMSLYFIRLIPNLLFYSIPSIPFFLLFYLFFKKSEKFNKRSPFLLAIGATFAMVVLIAWFVTYIAPLLGLS